MFRFGSNNLLAIKQTSTYQETFARLLEPGRFVTVTGLVHHNCLRFSIDFVSTSSTNVVFHFNPRLQQRYVVRNTRTNGCWGDEETTSPRNFEFRPREKFTVSFLITNDEYLVLVNGKHFCSYAHRISFKSVTGLEVQGNVDILGVETTDVDSYPPGDERQYHQIPFDLDFNSAECQTKEVPFVGLLPKGFRPGWQLEIYGKIKMLPHSFYVNLQDTMKYWPHPIIPLHLNPRFGTAIGGSSFVRNAWSPDQAWGNEERAPNFPFTPGYSFCMIIRMEMDGYSVWVDGKLTSEFRYPTSEVDCCVRCVYIQGDVFVNHVTIRQQIKDAYFTNPKETICRL